MKTLEQLKEIYPLIKVDFGDTELKAIQKDAYEQAIQDAANVIDNCGIRMGIASYFREIILALKKSYE